MHGVLLRLVLALVVLSESSVLATEPEGYSVDHPSYSPISGKIVFASDFDGNPDIYRINSDGTGLVRLTDGQARYSRPDWSPDGTQIAYEKRGPQAKSIVMVMDADGSDPHPITGGKYSESEPAWLPSSAELIVATSRNRNRDLLLISTSGSEVRYVAASSQSEGSPSSFPDGVWVAYEVVDDSEGLDGDKIRVHIWKRRLDDISNPPVQLTTGAYTDYDPRISPSGLKIVFSANRSGDGLAAWVMNADGTAMSCIPTGSGEALDPAWTSNDRIVFIRQMYIESGEESLADVCTVNLDGTALTQVTHTVDRPTFSPEAGTYSGTQTVTIASNSLGAVIRYTTDGTDPTETSTVYSAPIPVDHSLTLKARAWKTDWFPSHVRSGDYVIE